MDKPNIRKYGPRGILMEWEAKISPSINNEVVKTAEFLNLHYSDSILEVVPSYNSLLIFIRNDTDLERYIDICQYLNMSILKSKDQGRIWQVPVCYDTRFGFDLESISKLTEVSISEIIQLHSEANYRIYGMGFLPGFLYLGGLTDKIHVPRKKLINPSIPKGSVAIGGMQTGIYPQNSPGGWNVIGRTPIELFDVKSTNPVPFSVGDSIRFMPVKMEEYVQIELEVKQGEYQPNLLSND